MSNNGDSVEILKVTQKGGQLSISFGAVNLQVISHALRLASLQLDNHIVGMSQKQAVVPQAQIPKGLMDKLRGR